MRRTAWATIAVIAGLLLAGPAFPQATAQGGPTPSPPGAKVEFIDIKDGAVIGPKTTIHFGLHGMGVAPAGTKRPNSGHHHLLVDTDLPPLDKPIPNDENHLHFGGGQTETELSLPPGPHTLQLLLGDADHIPHTPPIYSDKIHVTVAESAAAGVDKPNSGHHHLLIDAGLPPLDKPIPNDENHLHFGAGQTEATVTLPRGRHTLQLLLGDAAHVPHDPPVYSKVVVVYVGMSPPAPPRVRHHRRSYFHGRA
jgi:hypothetical protein